MGMRSQYPVPIEIDNLQSHQFVACAIIKPRVSQLVLDACLLSGRTMTGAGMFEAHAETLVDYLPGREDGQDGVEEFVEFRLLTD
jgi:shikimate dehydrogenase